MGGTATRRQLLGGTAGALAVAGLRPAAAPAAPIPTDARPDVIHHGRAVAVTPDGRRLVVAHDARRTLAITDRRTRARRVVTLHGRPLELAVAPDGATLAATTAFWDGPGVELVALADGRLLARADVGPAPFAPAFALDGRQLLVGGGEDDGTLHVLTLPKLATVRRIALGRVPRGLAVTTHGAWVALHGEAALVLVDVRRGTIARRLAVPALPDRLAASPDGRRLLVSHGGHGVRAVSEVEVRTGRVRAHDAGGAVDAVAWTARGARLATVRQADAIAVLGGRRPRLLPTISSPRGIAVAGRHAFTTSWASGDAGRVRA